MKYTLVLAALICGITAGNVRAGTLSAPYFGDLRSEITNQLTIASNTAPLNKKLISQLNVSLKTIDKPVPVNTLATGTKTLGVLVAGLNKSSLSNVFDAKIQYVLDIYTADYVDAQAVLAIQLANTFPGKKKDTAQKALDKLCAAIVSAGTNLNSNLAAKALAAASKNLVASQKAVVNAQKVPLPPATVEATITISGSKPIKFKSILAVAPYYAGGYFFINAVSTSGSGMSTKMQSLSFGLPSLVEGANNVIVAAGGANQFTIADLKGDGMSVISTGGTAQVVWVPGSKAISGTFSFNAKDQDGPQTATITGSFTAVHQ